MQPVRRFVAAAEQRGLQLPGVFGVFYYRSAKPATLAALKSFLSVPVEALTREFQSGASAVEVCARTVCALREAGARHIYISNLPVQRAQQTLDEILKYASG
jgi:hypothetical protein